MKVLIISYNPLSLFNNGGKSMLSLFSSFDANELVQFYIYPVLPDKQWCHSFYRQADAELLNPWKNRKIQHVVNEYSDSGLRQNNNNQFYTTSSTHRHLKLILRDMLWKISNWNNPLLHEWIQSNRPDVIFSDTGDSCFLYRVSMKISKQYNLPIVGYFGDDYCSIKSQGGIIEKFQLFLLRRTIGSFVDKCKGVVFINDTFAQYYRTRFNITDDKKIDTIYNGSNFVFPNDYHIKNFSSLVISYIGNLSLGRGENLLLLGESIDKYNRNHGTSHRLFIYAKDKDSFSKLCSTIESISFKGFIPGAEVEYAIEVSDILVHTESFSGANIEKTMYSISTKIADSLNSGKCMLAVGPSEVASIQHLIRNDCAYCITSLDELDSRLEELFENPNRIVSIAKKGKIIADKYHNSTLNSKYLYSILESKCN